MDTFRYLITYPNAHVATCAEIPVNDLGGWMAVPGADDTGLLLALDATSTGYFIDEPGLLHRRWPGQTTASRSDDNERQVVLTLLDARAHALRASQNVTKFHARIR